MEINNTPWTPEPWLPYQATQLIYQIRPRNVFEWGTGGSTIAFLTMGAKVVSIEHDPAWATEVQREISDKGLAGENLNYNLIPYEAGEIGPDCSNPTHYKSYCTVFPKDINFKRYCSFIDNFGAFDLILIDGYARAGCIMHAIGHVKPGGWLVIDNTDRDWYLKNTLFLFGNYESGWERIDITGYGPILAYQWKTTFFRNANKSNYQPTE